jgi:hypothetical protein
VFNGLDAILTVATTEARISAFTTLAACTAGRSRVVCPAAGEVALVALRRGLAILLLVVGCKRFCALCDNW